MAAVSLANLYIQHANAAVARWQLLMLWPLAQALQ